MDLPGNPNNCVIIPNPDLVGIGIRLSIYILALSGPLLQLLFCSTKLTSTIDTILGLTGFAILLASLVLTFQNSLDIFHAWCAILLVQLAGVSVNFKIPTHTDESSLGESSFTTVLDTIKRLIHVLGYIVSFGFLLHILRTARTFGPTPQCNEKTFIVITGASVVTTNIVFRWLIGILSVFTVIIFILFNFGLWYFQADVDRMIKEALADIGFININSPGEEDVPAALPVLLSHLTARSYLVAMLELTIKQNKLSSLDSSGITSWSFGQIIAVAMLAAPILEVLALAADNRRSSGRWFGWKRVRDFWSPRDFQDWLNYLNLYIDFLVDLLISTTCAVAAASTALRWSPTPTTPHNILLLAARAGIAKSGIRFLLSILSSINDPGALHILEFAKTNIGFSVLLTTVVSQYFMVETPSSLQVAAVWAGMMQMLGGSLMWPGLVVSGQEGGLQVHNRVKRTQTVGSFSGGGTYWEEGGGGYKREYYSGWTTESRQVVYSGGTGFWWNLVWDAVAGWVFVKVAKGRGVLINAPNSAGFWAGFVYGLTRAVFKLFLTPITAILIKANAQAVKRTYSYWESHDEDTEPLLPSPSAHGRHPTPETAPGTSTSTASPPPPPLKISRETGNLESSGPAKPARTARTCQANDEKDVVSSDGKVFVEGVAGAFGAYGEERTSDEEFEVRVPGWDWETGGRETVGGATGAAELVREGSTEVQLS